MRQAAHHAVTVAVAATTAITQAVVAAAEASPTRSKPALATSSTSGCGLQARPNVDRVAHGAPAAHAGLEALVVAEAEAVISAAAHAVAAAVVIVAVVAQAAATEAAAARVAAIAAAALGDKSFA